MPNISNKGRSMPESPIRKLVPFAEGAKKRGINVHHLNIGQPDIETPQVALNAIHNFGDKVIQYSHSAGMASFREKLTGYYRTVNINVTADEIIVGAGASEALLFAFQSIMDPGDEVIIPEPFYANYNGFAKNAGINIVPILSSIDTGFALPPIEDFVNNITPRTKAILICNPNNPTGYLYSKEELDILKDIVKKYDLYLISDEVYREFTYDGKKHFSCMNLSGIENNVILIDSVSKRYSACGVRIGWLISKNKDVVASALKFAQARLSPPTLGQVAAEAALDTPDEYFSRVMNEYISRRNTVVEGINKIKDAFCPNPEGAFYVVAKLPIDDSDKFCKWLLEDFNYKNQTIMLAPASGFYSSPGKGKDEVRISYVLNVPDLNKSIKILEEGLKVYPGRTN
ncbi:MAG: pyridoxal phosphate-dependent aminotransferase [Bacteroidales bacterium]|jgi:aspartate aminotransferase|nr:aspartate aminotransferase [Lentimicrobiaceae bacterium]MDG1135265.1 pyridoxal phosphate-dependent aminotransferase [Bacteroidales bacterium]MDG1901737.1 pyridoxal phosphate-dependent aminotransferase [Bacteroidales bacterium]MDG2081763.1 pyridoxal phosphate-dependent aminotransferase [Bacteroidales bacterium]|tara:strand:+ start:476 stop:1675 length:1200 start_codon:yes stop_codon:yes gene_type:complete